MNPIDIGDIDTRTIQLVLTGFSGSQAVSIQFTKSGVAPVLANYVLIHPTSGSGTTYDLPLGTAVNMVALGVGDFYPVVRVVDGSNICTAIGDDPLRIRNLVA